MNALNDLSFWGEREGGREEGREGVVCLRGNGERFDLFDETWGRGWRGIFIFGDGVGDSCDLFLKICIFIYLENIRD